MGDLWVGIMWACILIFVWLRGKICVGEWCCEVVGSCEVQLSCEVQCSTSSQPDKNLYVWVCLCVLCLSHLVNMQCSLMFKWMFSHCLCNFALFLEIHIILDLCCEFVY